MGGYRKNSFIHSMTVQLMEDMFDGWGCAYGDPATGCEDLVDIRGRSDRSFFLPECLVVKSCVPGYTQWSNNRMFVMAGRGTGDEREIFKVVRRGVTEGDPMNEVKSIYTIYFVVLSGACSRMVSRTLLFVYTRRVEHKTSSDRS